MMKFSIIYGFGGVILLSNAPKPLQILFIIHDKALIPVNGNDKIIHITQQIFIIIVMYSENKSVKLIN